MLETPHVLVGAAIATQIPDPLVAIPLAFASHFVLDMVPHWNPHLNTELKKFGRITNRTTLILAGDVLLALGLGFFVAVNFASSSQHAITILLASLAAAMPDIIEAPYFFLGWKNKILNKLLAFQKSIQSDAPFAPGVSTQLITILAAFWWIS